MRRFVRTFTACVLLAAAGGVALALDGGPETHDFEGGKITITEKDDGQKEVAFDGRLLGGNYFVSFDQIVDVGGQPVALISIGDGGNACAPGTLIVFNNGGEVTSDFVGDDCGAPSPAVSSDRIVFVPYLLPGETADVLSWSPEERIGLAGRLGYAPNPGSGWTSLDPASLAHMLDAFRNEDVFKAASALLGDKLSDFAQSLSVGGQPETSPSGVYWSTGCVPHACGVSDGFMAIDPASRALYLAKQSETGGLMAWPDAATWPADVRDTMTKALRKD